MPVSALAALVDAVSLPEKVTTNGRLRNPTRVGPRAISSVDAVTSLPVFAKRPAPAWPVIVAAATLWIEQPSLLIRSVDGEQVSAARTEDKEHQLHE